LRTDGRSGRVGVASTHGRWETVLWSSGASHALGASSAGAWVEGALTSGSGFGAICRPLTDEPLMEARRAAAVGPPGAPCKRPGEASVCRSLGSHCRGGPAEGHYPRGRTSGPRDPSRKGRGMADSDKDEDQTHITKTPFAEIRAPEGHRDAQGLRARPKSRSRPTRKPRRAYWLGHLRQHRGRRSIWPLVRTKFLGGGCGPSPHKRYRE
jgi:hypothetical protein